MTTPLESLIALANASGWSVSLTQQPAYWEARLHRRLFDPPPGIINELAFGIGDTPANALDTALNAEPKHVKSIAYATIARAPLDLAPFLNLPPATPITRRRL